MWAKYNIDANVARRAYRPLGTHFIYRGFVELDDWQGYQFSKYSPSYLISNEMLSEIVKWWACPENKTALAVCGGGDMPLMLAGAGAKSVDVFDISIHAYFVMRVKMHMMKNNFSIQKYYNVLESLSGCPCLFSSYGRWDVVRDTFADNNDKYILNYLENMRGCNIFGAYCMNKMFFMSDSEYNAAKSRVPKYFNFMWSDLYELPGRINGKKYDVIYLSNVLGYANGAKQIYNIINKLSSNLNDDGIMIVDTLASKNKIISDLLKSDKRFKYDFCCDTVYMHAYPKTR